MATATATATNLKLACPCCGAGMNEDETPVLRLDLSNLDEIECGECNQTFSAAWAAEQLAIAARRWVAVAKWIDLAPAAVAGE